MHAVTIEAYGDPGGLRYGRQADPIPGADQVLIDIEAVGVAGVDAMVRRGNVFHAEPGVIPGSEVAGRVVAVGANISQDWLGRRVWGFTGIGGAYAELALAALADVTPLPDYVSTTDAVAIGGAGPVAHFALRQGSFEAGESVLIRGAAGSLGIASVELAVRGGASRIAVTTSSAACGDRLRRLGADEVLDRAGNGTGSAAAGYDVIIDVVGGVEVPSFIDRLRPNGRYVMIGAVAGLPPAEFGMSLLSAFQQSRSFATFSLDTVKVGERNRVREQFLRTLGRGGLTPVVDRVLPLAEAAASHRAMDAGEVFGRIVLRP